jgi:hypothetical protein
MWRSVDSVDLAGRGCSEDRFGTSGPMAWILDGASTVVPEKDVTGGPGDAVWLVERLGSELKTLCYEPQPLKDLVAEALRNTAAAAREEWERTPAVPPSAALGVVRHAGDHVQFLVLADVSLVLRSEAGAQWFIDRRVDDHNEPARHAMFDALRDEDLTFEQLSARIRPLLAEPRRSKMNRPGGYWVASTDPEAAHHALTGTVDGVDDVVVATDGFMRALDLFGLLAGPDELFTCDLADVAARIRAAEQSDPACRRYPRWSVSDDICAHRLRWVH